MNTRRWALALATAALLPAAANATTIYQQSALTTSDRGAYQYFGQALADDFVAIVTGTVGQATWTGSYYGRANPTGSESFTLNLFAGGSTPGALLYSTTGAASFTAAATPSYYNYTLGLAGPLLTQGTSYWVSIFSNDSPSNYAWANSSNGSSAGALNNNGGSFYALNGDTRSNHVFALSAVDATAAAVPEPGLFALFAVGFGASCLVARRSNARRDRRGAPASA